MMTIETVAEDRLYIWHMLFGMPWSHNDINVLKHLLCSTRSQMEYFLFR